jgi:phospholipase/carboxylesterase
MHRRGRRAGSGIAGQSMTPPPLATVEVETGPRPAATVVWLHGLGADGHDFEPAVPALVPAGARALRFVFPHAPVRPVTLNAGARMRAWYDIRGFDRHAAQDEIGVRESDAAIHALIRRENARGVATERIVLAGFSQGGAMALFTGLRLAERLAGIIGLSCYLLLAESFAVERQTANQATPIFLAHGSLDAVVDAHLGEETRALLEAAGYPVEWHSYPLPHAVSAEELAAIAGFLQRVL